MAKKKKEDRPDIQVNIDGTTTWYLSAEGASGSYTGAFRFRGMLTPMAQIAANREYRELLGTNPTFAPEHESFLAYALTQLKQRIIEHPPFWSDTDSKIPGDIKDENIINLVLSAAIDSEIKYKKSLEDRKLEALERARKAANEVLQRRKKEKDDEEKT